MMFIIMWYDDGFHEVCGSQKDIIALAHIFERRQIQFKVSTAAGYLKTNDVGVGDFDYWLKPDKSFDVLSNMEVK